MNPLSYLKRNFKLFLCLGIRQNLKQMIKAAYSLSGSYISWKLFCVLLNNDSPVVGVLSGSMEPGFYRGDILFLKPQKLYCGVPVVFSVNKEEISIVHRIIKLDQDCSNTECVYSALTKGDNNRGNDLPLYRKGQKRLGNDDMQSTAIAFIPYCGLPAVWVAMVPGLRGFIMISSVVSVFLTIGDSF